MILADPAIHRAREEQLMRHVRSLLGDDRLRVPTTCGRKPISSLKQHVNEGDHAVDVKRLLAEAEKPDRELQNRLPVQSWIDVKLSERRWGIFRREMARLKVICLSPTKELIGGASAPTTAAEVARIVSENPIQNVPATIVVCSTSGFARDVVIGESLVLIEPNDAGGWKITAPPRLREMAELFDAEQATAKRQRVRELIEEMSPEFAGSGIAADRLAPLLELPIQLVEKELKAYAADHPGLTAKSLDDRVVLFRDGSDLVPGGNSMPMKDRILGLFGHRGENEKKIAFLAERRALLGQQRDRTSEDLQAMEAREASLRDQFQKSASDTTRRRLVGQLVQLRHEITRRQQLVDVLNRQVDIVGAHQHSLELVRTGAKVRIADPEEMARDAAAAEEMLAQLQADTEIADIAVGSATITAEEQAMYEELNHASPARDVPVESPAEIIKKPEATPAPTRHAQPEAG